MKFTVKRIDASYVMHKVSLVCRRFNDNALAAKKGMAMLVSTFEAT